ncbi:MAG: DEAD/DEAH box helicase [Desulfobacteraceae bacterium]|nr:MAG: DEAD/DEAH box helicase [Desulfobacteraceae bacterium]
MNQELNVVVMPNGSLQLEWNITEELIDKSTCLLQEEIHQRYTADENDWLLFIGFCDKQIALSSSLNFWRKFAGDFTRKLSMTPELSNLRHNVNVPAEPDELRQHLESAPVMIGSEYLSNEVLKSVWDGMNKAFSRAIQSYAGTVEEFIQTCRPGMHLVGRVFFHLVENKDGDLPFAFLATYSTRLDRLGKSKHLPLKHALQEYGKNSHELLKLLVTVHRAAGRSIWIANLLESGELFHPMAWTAKEAFMFLKEVPIYETSGILCRIPNWWKASASGATLKISMGDTQPSYVGMDAILNFTPKICLGDAEMTRSEARQLLEESEGLAFIKNRWVVADPEKLKQVLDAYEKAEMLMKEDGISLKDALRFQLNPEKFLSLHAEDGAIRVENGQWLESVVQKLLHPEKITRAELDSGFKADLRPYQQKGLAWLYFLHSLRFGACLADDMGLGKTVQLLGFLNALKIGGKKPEGASLLVIPASLLANWVSEIQRFFPLLNYYVAHPEAHHSKTVEAKGEKALNAFDLVITTYSLVQKYEWLQSYSWAYVILDEAQAIKNPGAKQTRIVKKLSARNRIVLTGTPIENRLSDLWSLFDFLNPGLLGTSKEFSDFAKKIKNDSSGYLRLRKIISPYILRRMKTDKSVISDLPEKVEMKTYAALSKKQVALYQDLVSQIQKTIEQAEGIQRKGLILASIMKFKQICNHSDQYLGAGEFEEKNSGKFERLREICETIYEKREKALIFTQFKEMTEPLGEFLKSIFGRPGLLLHGSIPVGKRKGLINKFQSGEYVPFMVLSLKAGGVGLNLTEANHVIHFDRWWNPAVENQATDRAFRIGQKKNVMVHKFLTRGTIEEKIDLMLEDKSRLSNEVVAATGENWITEMKTEELMELFRLEIRN